MAMRWMILGVVLVSLFILGCCGVCGMFNVPQGSNSSVTGNNGVATTDSAGRATFNISGNDITFQFIDENTGANLSGLQVGFAFNDTVDLGVLFIIDPDDRIPPQMAILHGKAGDATNDPIFWCTEASSSAIGEVEIPGLRLYVKRASDVTSLVSVASIALKALYKSGVPLGKYAGSYASSDNMYTGEEYAKKFWRDVAYNTEEHVFFLYAGETPQAAAVSTAIDVIKFGFDYSAAVACGPTKGANRIQVTKIGSFELVGCGSLSMGQQTAGLARATASAVDERGLPLKTGSLELLSKANAGLGIVVPITNGGATVDIPPGHYVATVRGNGYSPKTQDIQVTQQGATIQETLAAWPTTKPVEPGQLSATISTTYCKFAGVDSEGFPLYEFGATGTATGPQHSSIGVQDDGGDELRSCDSWSMGSSTCERIEGQPASTDWKSRATNNFESGQKITFKVTGTDGANPSSGVSVLATSTATCPVCGDSPDERKC